MPRVKKDTSVAESAEKVEQPKLIKEIEEPKKRPRLLKKVETSAEQAGIQSVMSKVADIEKVLKEKLPEKKPRKKRVLSDEQKQVLRDRLVKARAVRAGNRPIVQKE